MSGNLQPMAVSRRPLGDYAPACGDEALERLRAAAAPLEGIHVAHVSGAGGGGRVPELLSAGLPLAAELGLAVKWLVLWGDDYDGGHKAWVRWPDGRDDIVPGSQVERD